ncbi:MAG: DUF1232 domain-containing protein [bacterium]|nr:DUF1232 domain-containing protein [bacterium]
MIKKLDDPPKAAKRRFVFSVILLIGGIVYTIFPIDLIPDVLGPVGWIDDIGFLLATCLNAAYSYHRVKRRSDEG